ncbi:hypothetical protein G9A89_000375, partial [Geosiphon pyriformis]
IMERDRDSYYRLILEVAWLRSMQLPTIVILVVLHSNKLAIDSKSRWLKSRDTLQESSAPGPAWVWAQSTPSGVARLRPALPTRRPASQGGGPLIEQQYSSPNANKIISHTVHNQLPRSMCLMGNGNELPSGPMLYRDLDMYLRQGPTGL